MEIKKKSRRVDIQAILADPKLRKELLERAAKFLIQIGRYT